MGKYVTKIGDLTDFHQQQSLWRPIATKGKNFQKDKRVGRHALADFGKDIAAELALETPNLYTGHCWRTTSALANAEEGATGTQLCEWYGWENPKTAQRYMRESKNFLKMKAERLSKDDKMASLLGGGESPPSYRKNRRVSTVRDQRKRQCQTAQMLPAAMTTTATLTPVTAPTVKKSLQVCGNEPERPQ